MSCREYDHYIQLYVDQEISEPDRRKLLEHTRTCHACRRELTEMVALVSSIEEARKDIHPGAPMLFRGLFKWVAVCTVAVSFAYFVIPLSQLSFFSGGNENSSVQPMQHSVMVLAAQEEPLFIPEDESIHIIRPGKLQEEGFKSDTTLVYPSAVSYFVEKKRAWEEYSKRFVFISVPDEKTLTTMLKYAGAKVDQLSGLAQLEYPTSIMISLDGHEYETFTFPEEQQDIRNLVQKITEKAVQLQH